MRVPKIPFLAILALSLLTWTSAGSRAQTGGAVLNKAGVPVKLITTRATQIHSQPDPSSDGAPCPAFKFWYVLPPEDSPSRKAADVGSLTRNGFYRVAADDSEAEFKGWIAESDAVEWHHRQAVKFAPNRGRQRGHFYPSAEDATTAVSSGDVGKATHREPESSANELLLMPLLKLRDVEIDDEQMQLYEVAFMAGRPETAPPSSEGVTVAGIEGKVTRERVRKESTIDVVFAVDTTASMQPVIEQVKTSIEEVAARLAADERLRPRLRFGLVAYRDTISDMTAMEYLIRVFCTLEEGKEHQLFLRRLGEIREARIGSEGYPEDVLAGVARAMDFDEMKWNPLGWKQIVVVGDSSMKVDDHPDPNSRRNEDNRTIAGIRTKAQSGSGDLEATTHGGFVISAVHVRDPEASEDHPIAERQFNQLVAGRTYNGKRISAAGGKNPEDFSNELRDVILDAVDKFDLTIVQGRGAGRQGSAGSTAADFPWPVLDIIAAIGGESSKGEGMHFDSRYSTEFDAEGNRVFVPHLFVRKGQLLSFNAMLDFLQGQLEDAGDPGNRDVAAIVKGLQATSATLNLAEPITAEMPIDKFLTLLLGFPLKNPIFRVTIGDLAAMSQTDYDDWVQSVKAQKDTLQTLTENPHIWKKLHHEARDRAAHAFVPLTDLP